MGQDLQAVLVVSNKLLVDVEHWQEDVEEIRCGQRQAGTERPRGERRVQAGGRVSLLGETPWQGRGRGHRIWRAGRL